MFRILLAALLLAVCVTGACADSVELKTGAKFFGKIVEDTDTKVTIATKEGTLTFDRAQLVAVHRDGESAPRNGPKSTVGPVHPDPSAKLGFVAQGPLEDLIAKVGPGGVTRHEYELYLVRAARDLGKAETTLTPDERRKALNTAIQEELIFQAALEDGMLQDPYIRERIIGTYRSLETTAKIDPQQFADQELQAYYDAHPEAFTEPAQVTVEALRFDKDTPREEIEKTLREARANPDAVGGWKPAGTIVKGATLSFAPGVLDPVVDLRVGEISEILEDIFHLQYLLRVTERAEEQHKEFAEARERVRFLLIGEKQKALDAELQRNLAAGAEGLSADEQLFQAAVKAGIARDCQIHLRIVNEYLAKKNVQREALLPELFARFPVEVRLKD